MCHPAFSSSVFHALTLPTLCTLPRSSPPSPAWREPSAFSRKTPKKYSKVPKSTQKYPKVLTPQPGPLFGNGAFPKNAPKKGTKRDKKRQKGTSSPPPCSSNLPFRVFRTPILKNVVFCEHLQQPSRSFFVGGRPNFGFVLLSLKIFATCAQLRPSFLLCVLRVSAV